MKKLLAVFAVLSLALALQACSSAETGDDGLGADDAPAADAGTDAVPPVAVENPDGGDKKDAQAPAGDQQAKADDSMNAPSTPPSDQAQAPAPAAPPATLDATPASQVASNDAPAEKPPTPPQPDPAAAAPAPAPAADAPADNGGGGKDTSSNDSGSAESYTVQRGDTLMKIAFEKYGDLYKWKQIYEANRDQIKDPNVIRVGMNLKLSGTSPVADNRRGEKYEIKQGDTLGTISNDVYGTPKKWRKIWENNKEFIPNPNKIFAGFFVYYLKEEGGDDAQPNATPADPAPAVNPAPMANADGTPPTAQANPPTTQVTQPIGQPMANPGLPPEQRMPASQGQPPAPPAAQAPAQAPAQPPAG